MMACLVDYDFVCKSAERVFAGAAASGLAAIAEEARQAATEVIKWAAGGWLDASWPNLFADKGSATADIRNSTLWVAVILAVMSLIIAGGRMALQRDGKTAGDVFKSLVVLVLATAAGIPTIRALLDWGDGYSVWIVNKGAGGHFMDRMMVLGLASGPAFLTGAGSILIIFFALLVMAIAFVQFVVLLLRTGVLVLLAGLLPVAAAAGMTGTAAGQQMRNRYFSWLLGLVLYKPAAATAIAAGMFIVQDAERVADYIIGLMMMVVAVIALPALMRLITPAVAAVGSGGHSTALAGLGIGGSLATGAIDLASQRPKADGGSGGGGGAMPSPTGAAQVSPSASPSAGTGGGGAAAGGAASAAGAAAAGVVAAKMVVDAAKGAATAAREVSHGALGEGEQ